MTPRAEELLSYLIGLGPVGETVFADPKWIAADLGIDKRPHRAQLYARLVRAGCVRRLSPHVFIVLKRIPAHSAKKRQRERKVFPRRLIAFAGSSREARA